MNEQNLFGLYFQVAYDKLVERMEAMELETHKTRKLLAELRGWHHKCLETTTTTGVENAERRTNHTA